jgi:flavin reductase (DIM6/NTAB) family NADH-FMN oxidoreductase RutF
LSPVPVPEPWSDVALSDPFEPASSGSDAAEFRQVLGHLPTGVTIIASVFEGEPVGLAVGTFFSVSLEPPMVGFCAAKASTSFPSVRAAGSFCASVLAHDQEAVSRVFASSGADKFRGLGWRRSADSCSPMVNDAVAWIDCSIASVSDAGDHVIVLGDVLHLEVNRSTRPLVFFRGGYHTIGL